MITKDLVLSYILQEMSIHSSNNTNSPFKKIIFKGGTLLSKGYLNYHRLSEDLDFTYYNVEELDNFSKVKRKRFIKRFLKDELLPELQKITDKYNLDFNYHKIDDNEDYKYFPTKANAYFMFFKLYSNSDDLDPIKFEINFTDHIKIKPKFVKCNNLNPTSKFLMYKLKDINILAYDVKEIALEKIRAIFTRERLKERDFFDLFIISEIEEIDIFKLVDKKLVIEKIKDSMTFQMKKDKLTIILQEFPNRIDELKDYIGSEISKMALKQFDLIKYEIFVNKLCDELVKLEITLK